MTAENPAFTIVLIFGHRNTVAVNSCEVHMRAGCADLLGHLQTLALTVGRSKCQSAAEVENEFIDHVDIPAEAAGSNNNAFRSSDIKGLAVGLGFNAQNFICFSVGDQFNNLSIELDVDTDLLSILKKYVNILCTGMFVASVHTFETESGIGLRCENNTVVG